MADRIYSIDAVRIIAIVFVVLIHTDPFQGFSEYGNVVNFIIKTTSRFAVPFFFVASGYLFAVKTSHHNPTRYFAARATTLASYYLFGLVLAAPVFFLGALIRAYVANQGLVDTGLATLAGFLSPIELLYYGTSISEILWFLPALFYSFAFIYIFVRLDKISYMLPIAIGFHIIGLMGASYTMFIDIPFEIRDALFFGVFYTTLGYSLYTWDWQPKSTASKWYLGLVVFFSLLQLGEFYLLGYILPNEPIGQSVYAPSYAITTVLLTLSLFLYLLSNPKLGTSTPLPQWGKYAVGIYVAHPPVLYVLHGVRDALEMAGYEVTKTILWHLLLTPATFFGALLLYLTAHKLQIIEIGGSHVPQVPQIRNLPFSISKSRSSESQDQG